MEVLIVLIEFEADAVLTCCDIKLSRVSIDHIYLLIDRVILLDDILSCFVETWFEC